MLEEKSGDDPLDKLNYFIDFYDGKCVRVRVTVSPCAKTC